MDVGSQVSSTDCESYKIWCETLVKWDCAGEMTGNECPKIANCCVDVSIDAWIAGLIAFVDSGSSVFSTDCKSYSLEEWD